MEFYQDISYYYDKIFPFKEGTFNFLLESFKSGTKLKEGSKKGTIVDVACGSGNYTIPFGQYGAKVYGYDLDESMIDRAKQKNKENHIRFATRNMMEINTFGHEKNSCDLVFCIGNSLVHLSTLKDIETFIKKVYDIVKKEGCFVVQIVNYNRVLNHQVTSLPTIHNTKDGVTFVRKYKHVNKNIEFSTVLTVEEEQKEFKQTVTLYPLLHKQLYSMFEKAGFTKIETFGGFNKSPFNEDTSFPLIIRGYK